VTWEHDRNLIKLTQSTAFPYAHKTKLTVSTAIPDRFGIGIRVPDWIAGTMSARVNGQAVQGGVRRGWYVVSRRWKDGDWMEVEIPQDFWVSVLGMKKGGPAAIMHGPLVMALTTPSTVLFESLKDMRVYDWDEQMEISSANSVGNASQWWSYQGMLQTNPDRGLLASLDLKKIKSHVTPEDKRLTFKLKSNPDVRLKPFMNFGEGELYYMYIPGGPR